MSNTGHKYISETEDGFVLTPPRVCKAKQRTYTFQTLEAALHTRKNFLGPSPAVVEDPPPGPVAKIEEQQSLDPQELWDAAFRVQERVQQTQPDPWYTIRIDDDRPVAVALLSDAHFGSPHVNYRALLSDADIVASTEGMFSFFLGDARDNFVLSKLSHARHDAEMPIDAELALYQDWMGRVSGKSLAWVTGNHDLWTKTLAGIDLDRLLLPKRILYDPHVLHIRLQLGDAEWCIKLRHRWPYRSIYNPTHGIETSWERGQMPFDIGIGGDSHIGTLFRDFLREGKRRLAVLIGTYKNLGDPFHRQIGKLQCPHDGCGALIFCPDGRIHREWELQSAADYLKYLRK